MAGIGLQDKLLGDDAQQATPPKMLWTITIFLSMTGIGIALASLGPTLLGLAEFLGIPLKVAVTIFTIRALGYLFGAIFIGDLVDKVSNVTVLFLIPMAFASAGALVIPHARNIFLMDVLFFFQGAAMGVLDVGGNVLILTLWRDSPYLNGFMHGMHFFFGLGAFIGPFVVSIWLSWGYTAETAWALVGLMLAPSSLAYLLLVLGPQPKVSTVATGASSVNKIVVVSGIFLFIYVGIEVTYGGYISAFAVKWVGASAVDGAKLTSLYWALLCFGRLVAAFVTPFVHHARYLVANICLAVFSAAALTASTGVPTDVTVGSQWWWVGVVVPTATFGFALAPLFPGAMLLTEELLGCEMSGRAASLIVTLAAAGEMVIPFVIGELFAIHPMNFCWGMLVSCLISAVVFLKHGGRVLVAPSGGAH